MGKSLLSFGPWSDPVVSIAGIELTLDDIEHRILRAFFDDHRIHFAVNCASFGCPNLTLHAFTADTLEAQLAEVEIEYINDPRGARFDANGRLTISSLFDWYRDDFASSEAGVLDYIARLHRTHAAEIARYDRSVRYEYDWTLNAQPR